MGEQMVDDRKIDYIEAPGAPPPGGHYSQAVRHGGLLYISGQLPVSPADGHRPDRSFEDQARQVLDNLVAVLDAAGAGVDDLLKVTVYVVGVENWGAFNGIYAERVGAARPARAIVPVPELHHGYLVEIDATAKG